MCTRLQILLTDLFPVGRNVLPYQLELVRETAHLRSNRQVLGSGWDAMAQQLYKVVIISLAYRGEVYQDFTVAVSA